MEVTFSGLRLRTAPGLVMTPRPASEALVDAAVRLAGRRALRIADVGTGSGAIAVALAVALPRAEVVATDTSASAVALARANVCRLGIGDRVSVYRGDLLEPIRGRLDLVVANLPYLPAAEAARDAGLAGEPLEAIVAPGDGLGLLRRVVAASRERLAADGHLVIQLRGRAVVASWAGLEGLARALATPLAGEAVA